MASLREALNDDKVKVADIHVRSWRVGYRGVISDDVLNRLDAQERIPHYRFEETGPGIPITLLAFEGDEVLGFVTFGRSSDPEIFGGGEILALYVDPDHWGMGVGRTLLSGATTALREMSFSEASLWVLNGNRRAERFYGANGWSPDGTTRRDVVWGVEVDVKRYGSPLV